MNNGGDAAEQVVRLSLEGFEVAAKLTGSAAKNVALLLVSVLKQEQQTKGKARLTNMIKSGKELKVFSMDRYSAANALLIYKQQPQATQLKDFRDWQEDGVKVNKGAKSLSILEPVEYTKNDGSTGIAYNVKKVFDVAQTSGKKPAAPTLDRDPRKLVAIMLDTAPIDVSTVEELPSPNMGAFYKNEDQTLYIKRDIGNSVALCQCVAQELGHAQLAMNCEAYSRRDMGFSAVCVGYMLCRKFGVDVKNFAIDRIPEELAGKSPKEIRAELSKTRSAMSEIGSRVSEEIYRRRADRSKDQER